MDERSTDAPVALSFAAGSASAFVEPWYRRVRDVDDATLAGLLKLLVGLRRIKLVLATLGALLGWWIVGWLGTAHPLEAIAVYATVATFFAMPTFAGGTLAVRRLFLREGKRHGLSRSATTLVMTRAERRARFMLSPFTSDDERVEVLLRAVRDPDTA